MPQSHRTTDVASHAEIDARSIPATASSCSHRASHSPSAVISALGTAVLAGLLFGSGEAAAVCTPDPPTADGETITCTDEVSDGYDTSDFEDLRIDIDGASAFDDSGPAPVEDVAIKIGNLTRITTGAQTTIDVTRDDGVGIQGAENNFVDNGGVITIDGARGRGIRTGANTNGILPNGVVNSADIIANGASSVAIETGDDAGVATSGLIDLIGNDTIGIDAANHLDYSKAANITNADTINATGVGSIGIRTGDGWIGDGSGSGTPDPGTFGIFNASGATINVDGTGSAGIFAGDPTNATGNHNSFVVNQDGATISVTGMDAIGISMGGNDLLDPDDAAVNAFTALRNDGLITGDEDAGPLVEFRSFVAGFDNRFVIGSAGEVTADLTNQGTADRAMAIRGSDGDEVIVNFGLLRGDLELRDGDNFVANRVAGTSSGEIEGNLSFGDGDDILLNQSTITGDSDFGDGDNSIDNAGSITGNLSFGSATDTIFNASSIIGDIDFGDGDNSIDNTGSITGNLSFGDGTDAFTHTGSLEGSVDLGSGDDTFTFRDGAAVNFAPMEGIDGGADNDVFQLEADPTATTTAVFDFDATQFSNFEILRIQSGTAGWQLVGDLSTFDGLTEILDGSTLRVTTPMTLGGDFAVAPTGTLALDLNAAGDTPLTVAGAATFDGTLQVTVDPGLAAGDRYTLIATTLGNSGQFRDIGFSIDGSEFGLAIGTKLFTPSYEFAGLSVSYDDVGFAGVARGSNQRAIAQNLTDIEDAGLAFASAGLQDLIDDLNISLGNLSSVYQTLTPEAYDAQTTIHVEGGRRVANLLLDRPRECDSDARDLWKEIDTRLTCHARRWSPWIAAVGGFRSRDGFDQHLRYDSQIGGLAFGVDSRPIEGLEFTFVIASQRGTINAAGADDSKLTLVDLMAHSAWSRGPLRVQGLVGWAYGDHDSERQIQATEDQISLNQDAKDTHDSSRVLVAGEVGLLFEVGVVEIEPLVGVDWAWINQGAIKEADPSGLGLRIDSREDDVGSFSAGMRLSTAIEQNSFLARQLEWMDGSWRPRLDVRWRQIVEGDKRNIDARFRGAPDGVGSFRIQGDEDDGGVEIGAAVSFIPKEANRLQIDLGYDAFIAENTLEQNLVGRVTIGF